MVIVDIVLTIVIDKSNSTWYDVLVQDRKTRCGGEQGTLTEGLEMKILVVDDNIRNRRAAREQLEGHDLTIVDSLDKARFALESGRGRFDVVLCDMELPESDRGVVENHHFDGDESCRDTAAINEYGFSIAMLAIQRGVRRVAMVTSTFHHHSPMAYMAFVLMRGGALELADGARLIFEADSMTKMRGVEDPKTRDQCVKDWRRALARLIA